MEDKDIDDKKIEVQEDDEFGERSNVSNENVNSLNRQDNPEFDGNSHFAHKQPVKNAYVMPLPTFFASLYNKKPVNDEYEKPSTSKRQSEKPTTVVFPSTSTHHDRLDVKQKRKCNQGIIFKPKAYQRAPAPQRPSTFTCQIGKLADTKPENTFKHKTANYKDFPKYEPRFTPKMKKRLHGSRNMGSSTESIGNYHYRLAPNSRPDSFRFENWTYCFDRPSTSTSVADKSCKRSKGKETETTKKDESKSEKDPNKETDKTDASKSEKDPNKKTE